MCVQLGSWHNIRIMYHGIFSYDNTMTKIWWRFSGVIFRWEISESCLNRLANATVNIVYIYKCTHTIEEYVSETNLTIFFFNFMISWILMRMRICPLYILTYVLYKKYNYLYKWYSAGKKRSTQSDFASPGMVQLAKMRLYIWMLPYQLCVCVWILLCIIIQHSMRWNKPQ